MLNCGKTEVIKKDHSKSTSALGIEYFLWEVWIENL